jgi:hypothetical protein
MATLTAFGYRETAFLLREELREVTLYKPSSRPRPPGTPPYRPLPDSPLWALSSDSRSPFTRSIHYDL